MAAMNCSISTIIKELENVTEVDHISKRCELETGVVISELDILTLIVQIIGAFFLVTSLAMFIKDRLLQKKENAYQVCVLASNAMLLLFDWRVFMSGYSRCDVFSLTFLLFGSASTLSSLAIALDRFRRMSLLFSSSQRKAQYSAGVILIWILSLSTIALPLYGLIHAEQHSRKQQSENVLCFFKDGLLHSTFGPSLYFTIVSTVIPTFGMLVCYIGIFRSVKKARISRWINHASAEASRKAVMIQTNGRKANIVALPSTIERPTSNITQRSHPAIRQSQYEDRALSKERSILLKGVLSVCLVIFWFPFTGQWLITSISGFKTACVNHFQLFILLAKVSSVLRIVHYIILNPKYKHLYLKMVCNPCKNRIGAINSHRGNSQIESNADTGSIRTDRVFSVKERQESIHCVGKGTLETIKEISTLRKQ